MNNESSETESLILSIPTPILRKAQRSARKRNMSLPELLTQLLATCVEQDEQQYELARQRSLASMERGYDLGTNGKITWSRDECMNVIYDHAICSTCTLTCLVLDYTD